jgi:hypothetical protein
MLPEPEWSLLAQVARGDDSFALQLQGAHMVCARCAHGLHSLRFHTALPVGVSVQQRVPVGRKLRVGNCGHYVQASILHLQCSFE